MQFSSDLARPAGLPHVEATPCSCLVHAQPMVQASGEPGGTLYVVNSQSSSQDSSAPRLLGLLSGFQLQPPSFQVPALPLLLAAPPATHRSPTAS